MKALLTALVVLTGVVYPFIVYFGFDSLSPRWFAVILALVWLLRSLTATGRQHKWQTSAVLVFCLLLFAANEPQLLHWYPVLINLLLMAVFGASLRYGPPLIERLARLQEAELPHYAIAYTRKVTVAWVLFFIGNTTVAAVLTLWAPRSWWLLYNGFIAYILIGLMFAIEWWVRQRVRNAHELD